jgi:hypothetical protein
MQSSSSISTQSNAAATMDTPNATSWVQNIFASILNIFTHDNGAKETEAEAMDGWIGTRKGRGRCRSVGEVQ